ncbi:TPA: ATP-binding protein [Streptococcus suis]|nr:ATP-binding protein [Streptococcus suis]
MSKLQHLVPDAYNLIESQRSIGYTFETAIADIIDNSISAQASTVDIFFDSQEKYLCILDDGFGISQEELLVAMKYGSKSSLEIRNKEDLGRFGLGLKMASFSQCRRLTVFSKQKGELVGAIWDLDLVKEMNSWVIEVLSLEEIQDIKYVDKLQEKTSGTLVVWEKFDKFEQHADFQRNFDESIEKTEDHLSLVFHRFLQSKHLVISFNGRMIDYIDPFFTSNKATQPKSPDIILEKNRGAKINVQPYIVPYKSKLTQKERRILMKYESNKLEPGLYIYRNKRLIAWGKWFKLVRTNDLANLAKIQIDIPNSLDDLWEIDVKKSQLKIPASIREQLKNIIVKNIGESERVYQHRGTIRNRRNLEYVFNRIEKENKISYHINLGNPLLVQLKNNLSDSNNRLLNLFIKQVEDYLPLESIQYDMGSKRELERDNTSEDTIYEEVMLLLENQSSLQSKIKLLQSLKNLEVYSANLKILNRIEEELND